MAKEFVWPVRVYYEDTDVGGVVYYANYLKFMERARTEWIRALGFEQDELIRQLAVIFAVRAVHVDYLQPARFNDALTTSVMFSEMGRASMTLEQTIRRQGQAEVLCQGTVKIVSLDSGTFRPVAIPKPILEKLQSEGWV